MVIVRALSLAFGLMVTLAVGESIVTCLHQRAVKEAGEADRERAPVVTQAREWETLWTMKAGGRWIGWVERPMFFAVFWIPGGWPVLASWLTFKLAIYWQGTDYIALPRTPMSDEEAVYWVARRRLGANHIASILVGTGGNIVVALLGVGIGRFVEGLLTAAVACAHHVC